MAYMKTRLTVEMLLQYRFLSVLVNKLVDIAEEDICFAVTLSLVSRDPFLQIWRPRCWVSCAEAVFCAFGRFKGCERAPIHTILNDNTFATIFQLLLFVCFIQMSIIT